VGGNCLKIVRIEDGSLGEIVDLALEIFPKGIPGNSVILLGSGTHLLRTGSSGYSKTWVEMSDKLVRWCPTAQICPLPPVLSGPNPGSIFRSIVELRCWVSNYFKSDVHGLEELWDCTLSQLTQNTGKSTPLPSAHSYTLVFPTAMSCGSLTPLLFTRASSCPASVLGPSCKAVTELLLVLSQVLNRDFHSNLTS